VIEPSTIPDPEEVTGHECGHSEDYGRVWSEGMERCGRCGAPLRVIAASKLCSCQRVGGYDTECLLTGRCAEGRTA
jgi:hypothetical protein